MLQELDTVATLVDRLDIDLVAGEVGAITTTLAEGVYEVEFIDADGKTYATAAFRSDELLKLHHRARAA